MQYICNLANLVDNVLIIADLPGGCCHYNTVRPINGMVILLK